MGHRSTCWEGPGWQPWANLMDTHDGPAGAPTPPLLDGDLLGDTQVMTEDDMKALSQQKAGWKAPEAGDGVAERAGDLPTRVEE